MEILLFSCFGKVSWINFKPFESNCTWFLWFLCLIMQCLMLGYAFYAIRCFLGLTAMRTSGQAWHGPAYAGARVLCSSARRSGMVHLSGRVKAWVQPENDQIDPNHTNHSESYLILNLTLKKLKRAQMSKLVEVLKLSTCGKRVYNTAQWPCHGNDTGAVERLALFDDDPWEELHLLPGCLYRGRNWQGSHTYRHLLQGKSVYKAQITNTSQEFQWKVSAKASQWIQFTFLDGRFLVLFLAFFFWPKSCFSCPLRLFLLEVSL